MNLDSLYSGIDMKNGAKLVLLVLDAWVTFRDARSGLSHAARSGRDTKSGSLSKGSAQTPDGAGRSRHHAGQRPVLGFVRL